MKNSRILSFLLLLCCISIISCDKDNDKEPLPEEITSATELTAALETIFASSDVPGFAVSVIKNEQLIYQEAFGSADQASGRAYTNETVQPIGSISKTFIAAAIVKAIEQGHFTLETPINDILPAEIVNPKYPDGVIQVKHLLTHSSGLVDRPEAYFQAYYILPGENMQTAGADLLANGLGLEVRTGIPLEELLAEYYLEGGSLYHTDNFAAAAPGTSWNYSNLASSLAAYLIETATGIPFDTYVNTHILQPLAMQQTAYGPEGIPAEELATLYWDEQTPLPKYANDSYPDGSLCTTNTDLAKYLLDMMVGAQGQSGKLFSPEGYALLFSPLLADGQVPPTLAQNQGIFWSLGEGLIHHDGSDPGTTCSLQFDQNGESGYLLLSNMDASTDGKVSAWLNFNERINQAISSFSLNQ